ncbi:MAG TPA: PASTA domain-containing protein [Gaiellaceae bacterium]|nr:PASTA domain-containing protein [Gaiellaceae bacterium]
MSLRRHERVALALAVGALALPAAAEGMRRDTPTTITTPSGTLVVCSAQGARPVSGTVTFTLAAPAADGGTITAPLSGQACTSKIFYPVGTTVTVDESLEPGYVVTSISFNANGGSRLTANTPAGGTATVSVGAGDATITFVTSGPPRPCVVPHVVGLTLGVAKTSLARGGCTAGRVTKAYSRTFKAGRVVRQSSRAGVTLAPAAPVSLVLSRGPA